MALPEIGRKVVHGGVEGDRGSGEGWRGLLWRQALDVRLLPRSPRRVRDARGLRLVRVDGERAAVGAAYGGGRQCS